MSLERDKDDDDVIPTDESVEAVLKDLERPEFAKFQMFNFLSLFSLSSCWRNNADIYHDWA